LNWRGLFENGAVDMRFTIHPERYLIIKLIYQKPLEQYAYLTCKNATVCCGYSEPSESSSHIDAIPSGIKTGMIRPSFLISHKLRELIAHGQTRV